MPFALIGMAFFVLLLIGLFIKAIIEEIEDWLERRRTERRKQTDLDAWYRQQTEPDGPSSASYCVSREQVALRALQLRHPDSYNHLLAIIGPNLPQIVEEAMSEQNQGFDLTVFSDQSEIEYLRQTVPTPGPVYGPQPRPHEFWTEPLQWYAKKAVQGFRSEARALCALKELTPDGYHAVLDEVGINRPEVVNAIVRELHHFRSTKESAPTSWPTGGDPPANRGFTPEQKREIEEMLAEERHKALREATARAWMLDHWKDK